MYSFGGYQDMKYELGSALAKKGRFSKYKVGDVIYMSGKKAFRPGRDYDRARLGIVFQKREGGKKWSYAALTPMGSIMAIDKWTRRGEVRLKGKKLKAALEEYRNLEFFGQPIGTLVFLTELNKFGTIVGYKEKVLIDMNKYLGKKYRKNPDEGYKIKMFDYKVKLENSGKIVDVDVSDIMSYQDAVEWQSDYALAAFKKRQEELGFLGKIGLRRYGGNRRRMFSRRARRASYGRRHVTRYRRFSRPRAFY